MISPIIPTVFAHNKEEFNERFKKLIKISKNIHVDFMDGKFVKAKSIQLRKIPNLKKYKNNFEAHLMIQNPIKLIKKIKQKGFKKIIFHYESNNPEQIISTIKKLKLSTWIAINPETEVEKIYPFLRNVGGILFMGVHPGKEHQKFIQNVYKKIQKLRKTNKKIKIQVDGGVTPQVIKNLAKHKVNYINSGSYISDSKNPGEELNRLNSAY